MIEYRKPWRRQPNVRARVDRTHPLGGALDALWVADGGTAPVDLIGGIQSTGGASLSPGVDIRIGRVIVGSTSAGTVFAPRFGSAAYPYVAVAHWISTTNNGWTALSKAGSGGQLLLGIDGASKAFLTARRNFGTSRTLATVASIAVETPICAVVVIYSDTDYRLFANGEQVNGTLSFGSGGAWLTSMVPVGNQLTGRIALVGYGMGRQAPTDDEARRITANHTELWRMLEPRRIFVPQAGIALPTLSAATWVPGSLTASGFRPRVTAATAP